MERSAIQPITQIVLFLLPGFAVCRPDAFPFMAAGAMVAHSVPLCTLRSEGEYFVYTECMPMFTERRF